MGREPASSVLDVCFVLGTEADSEKHTKRDKTHSASSRFLEPCWEEVKQKL